MSRGPGTAQRRVLETLAAYERLGRSLGWKWHAGGSFYRRRLAWPEEIAAYEAGRRVEIWMLRRDTGLSAAEVSRALRSLYRRGYVWLYGATADHIDANFRFAKFARIASDGKHWVSANNDKETKLAVSERARAA